MPKAQIDYIDGYGNIKTTLELEDLSFAPGTLLEVRIGQATQKATAANASFEIPVGEMALAPGSSGWRDAEGHPVRWMELFLRGGNAWEAFGRPPVGASIEIISQSPSGKRRPKS